MSGPRLLFVADRIAPGDARYIKLRASFAAAGFTLAAVAPQRGGERLHESVTGVAGVERHPVGAIWKRAGDALAARALAEAVVDAGAQSAPHILYVFDPEALPAALALKRRTGARLIYDAHEFHVDEHPDEPERSAWVARAEARAAPFVDAFVTVNAGIGTLYAQAQPALPPALIVHNAVDPGPLPADDGRLRRAAGLDEDARILLFQGRLAPMRGIESLIEAAPMLDAPWRLVLMGDGPLATPTTDRVQRIAPAPHAELPAWTVGAALGAALYEDKGLSQHHCSPNKLWEYAAAGVPILASDLPEIARVVRGHNTGVLIHANATAEAIAATVNALTPAKLATMGRAARAFAEKETWSQQVAPLIQRAVELAR